MKKIVVLTGAGMSAESGLATFRGSGGLWGDYRIEDVATAEAWVRNPRLVLDFYNQRRKELLQSQPNEGHLLLAMMEEMYDVRVVTQNVDNLHEQAGSSCVLHLHGELMKVRSSGDESLVYDLVPDCVETKWGDLCEKGFQLRPHIVWFGEAVPLIEQAAQLVAEADVFVVIGTSMNVYPAAGLIQYVRRGVPIYLIDPNEVSISSCYTVHHIFAGAVNGVPELRRLLEAGD